MPSPWQGAGALLPWGTMPWIRRRLRGAKVWVRSDGTGAPLAGADGRVDVLYSRGGKLYRAAARNLEPDDDPAMLTDEEAAPGSMAGERYTGPQGQRSARPDPASSDVVYVYTDGACTGNPGPMGIGVVLIDGDHRREVSEYLGLGTNNIAELTAILRGLELAPRDRPVVVYSDSSYALGLLGRGWRAKANQELVARLRRLMGTFQALRLVKVAGHAGVVENERCDELARQAIVRGRSSA